MSWGMLDPAVMAEYGVLGTYDALDVKFRHERVATILGWMADAPSGMTFAEWCSLPGDVEWRKIAEACEPWVAKLLARIAELEARLADE